MALTHYWVSRYFNLYGGAQRSFTGNVQASGRYADDTVVRTRLDCRFFAKVTAGLGLPVSNWWSGSRCDVGVYFDGFGGAFPPYPTPPDDNDNPAWLSQGQYYANLEYADPVSHDQSVVWTRPEGTMESFGKRKGSGFAIPGLQVNWFVSDANALLGGTHGVPAVSYTWGAQFLLRSQWLTNH